MGREPNTQMIGGLILALIAICGCYVRPVQAQPLPETSVVFLVDMSASFAPLKVEDKQALEAVTQAVMQMALEQWRHPVSFFWVKIGTSSINAEPPCGRAMQYRPRLVEPGPRQNSGTGSELFSREKLKAWFDVCILRLTRGKIPVDQYTDLSGAVQVATESARGVRGLKVIIILSDFDEDLPPGRPPVRFALSSERVVMIYRPEPSDSKDPNLMLKRLVDWENRFKMAGARDVCRIPVRGLLPGSVARCLTP